MTFPSAFYRWRPHPWHGLEVGPNPPHIVYSYIEITPYDLVKYEVDKVTGYLKVDRPQHSSSQPPTLYGFVPRTYCGQRVGALATHPTAGDGDPLDICVISERPIDKSEVILSVRVIGGIEMIDGGFADDKIVGVLANDNFWKNADDISDLPEVLVQRLRHYFSTYKMMPDNQSQTYIEGIYHCEKAKNIIEASMKDYEEMFGT